MQQHYDFHKYWLFGIFNLGMEKLNRCSKICTKQIIKDSRKVNENNGARARALFKTFSSLWKTTTAAYVVSPYCLPLHSPPPTSFGERWRRALRLMPHKSIFCPLLTKLIGLGINVNEVDWPLVILCNRICSPRNGTHYIIYNL